MAAFCNACEDLEQLGAFTPTVDLVNEISASYGCRYQVQDGELIESVPVVEPPTVELSPRDSVAKALADATALLFQGGAASGIGGMSFTQVTTTGCGGPSSSVHGYP